MNSSNIPISFICPITTSIMTEPVIDNEGNSYEKYAITKWLDNHTTSPITRNFLSLYHLKVNRALKDLIDDYVKSNEEGQSAIIQPTNDIQPIIPFIEEEFPINLNMKSILTNKNEVTVNISIESIEGTRTVPMDIVAVIDVSGSMDGSAKVQQNDNLIDVGFSVLDITKHALKTVIESMKNNDRISIITFSDNSKIICDMTIITPASKEILKNKINNLSTEGCTNLWSGILAGLTQFSNIEKMENRVSAMLLMTDGVPSSHLLPTRGIKESLLNQLKKMPEEIIPTIYTFGFGYSLDTELLVDIAKIGNGNFSFIPDSGFVGTIIVHSIANISTTIARNAKLNIQPSNSYKIKKVIGYDTESLINLDTIHYGQNKDIIIIFDISNINDTVLTFYLNYISYNGKTINIPYTFIKEPLPIVDDININLNILRLEFVDTIKDVLDINTKLEQKQSLIKLFIDKNSKYIDNNIMIDTIGQVSLAVSTENYYKKWGKNYLYSIMYAHKQQRCNNFKDISVSNYGGKLFKEQRDIIDDIFSNMPAPVPSRTVRNADNGGVYNSQNSSNYSIMSTFNCRDNGCFHENVNVHMADGSIKKIKYITKGDIVKCSNNNTAIVVCVIKMDCYNKKNNMSCLDSGLMITPYHPIKYNNEWVFPANIEMIEEVECSVIYNLILDTYHTVLINNIECITLGHGFVFNDIVKHDFYGTQKVINNLSKMKGFVGGDLHFLHSSIIRNMDGSIKGYDISRLYC